MNRLPETEKAILKTVVYYDCLDYPLNSEELEKFIFIGKRPEADFLGSLKKLNSGNLIDGFENFYFLKNRQELVGIREQRNKIALEKWKKTLKAVRWLQMVPYVRLVFASGSLTYGNTDEKSDLDVLLVAKFGRIWTARFLVAGLTSLLGVRRTRYEKIAPDKICLNHFITDKSLYIPLKSIYTAQLYARLVPILVEDQNLLDDFCEANKWVGEYVRGWPECIRSSKYKVLSIKGNIFFNLIKKFGEKILDTKLGDWLETLAKKYQMIRIKSSALTEKPGGTLSVPKNHAERGGRVKVSDYYLEFHPDSPEFKIIERYNQTMIKLGFPELAKEVDSGLAP